MKPFLLHEPTTVDEAVALLAESGGDAKLYAGGTELLLAMKAGVLSYGALVNVKTIPGFDAITLDGGELVIGAAATHAAIEHSPLVLDGLPLLADVERRVANVRVRNVGTLAGNLCFADPHSDPATLLLVLNATLTVAGPHGARSVAIADLQLGPYETSLAEDELVLDVRIPPPPAGMRAAYVKFGHHHRPTLGVAAALVVEGGVIADARLALGCVGPVASRLTRSEDALRGARVAALAEDSPTVREAARLAAEDADAIDDLHGSAEYKDHLAGVFVERALREALASNGGGGGGSRERAIPGP